MVKLVAVYKKPDDPEAFEKHYFEKHVPLAKKMPGLVKCEIEKVTGSPVPINDMPYMAAHMYFDNKAALHSAMMSEEGKAAAKDLAGFAGKYVRMFFTELVDA